MNVFRAQENVPDVYPRKSRDFQLLTNVFDCMNNGVKYDIDSIRDVTDTNLCNERLLNYLQTKLGFFTNIQMNSEAQRIVLKAFPYLIKNKGSEKGICQAIEVFLKTQGVYGKVTASYINREIVSGDSILPEGYEIKKMSNTYVVELKVQHKILDTTILTEILKYIIPAGYIIKYSFYVDSDYISNIYSNDSINIIFVEDALNSGLRLVTDEGDNYSYSLNAVSSTNVPDRCLYITFTGDGNTKVFTIPDNIGVAKITINGELITEYSVSGNTITFDNAPDLESKIIVAYIVSEDSIYKKANTIPEVGTDGYNYYDQGEDLDNGD